MPQSGMPKGWADTKWNTRQVISHKYTIQEGYELTFKFVAEYGPVSIQDMRMHLQVQTNLTGVQVDSAILQAIEQGLQDTGGKRWMTL
jgi:hypothetical protein